MVNTLPNISCWSFLFCLVSANWANLFCCLPIYLSTEEAYQSGRGVLVHCQAGVSRSATIVIAYLMKHTLMTMTDAYKYVRSRRPVVSPNLNFMGQLLEFERDLNSGVTPRILMPKLNGVETQVWESSGQVGVTRKKVQWDTLKNTEMVMCLGQ